MTTTQSGKKRGLVLSGGGARGAYEAGVIHYICTKILSKFPKRKGFDVICGSSVGAINTCFMAATAHNVEYQGQKAFQIWNELKQSSIYKRDVGAMTRFITGSLRGVFRNVFGASRKREEGKGRTAHFKGLLDTSPFPFFLRRVIPWKQISLNIQNGVVKAISVTATNVYSGKMELFIDKHPSVNYTGLHSAHFVNIDVRHALASAAIPLLFPMVRIERNYYCDGGLRLHTPLSPAIQLGAERVLVIGLHHIAERAEPKTGEAFGISDEIPTMGDVGGQVLKSVFLDRLDNDLEQLARINTIIGWSEKVYGPDYLEKVNRYLLENGIKGDIANRGLKKLEVMSIFPSVDIRKIFAECIQDPAFLKQNLTGFEKLLMRLLDVDIRHGNDFLSFILFMPTYLRRVLALGFEDAQKNHDQLVQFFED
ncbi:MAG: patatin-like phospholipase family protein [Deltaproteobacteria bacterium]|nr:patatin-like phospholipase family protein [Deltaproteobacteria bacterium]